LFGQAEDGSRPGWSRPSASPGDERQDGPTVPILDTTNVPCRRALSRRSGDVPCGLRHGVSTHLVGDGKLLKAQGRLGHRDSATTLRHYAHAAPLDDQDVADDLDDLLNRATGNRVM